ncbi:class I SAM-dependent methyltransferase [Pseudanabaena sp. PCC 6802]|uniref:class I SAM-dependent methyltransferase n=1 Tax=Pseudanabaena sp. PCC 6802 TaxID=118173 RepID=UPI00034572FA|nr:class I SAM-dependent methyltransferase [Pseudanabaena sp. PCC 6802]
MVVNQVCKQILLKMRNHISWQYDEFKQVGRDYGSKAEVDVYDSSHADFRDIEAESDRVLDVLKIGSTDTLIDFGSGTGVFAIQAARRCSKVYAVDVSQAMLALASTRAGQAGVSNIEFHHAGFLTYEHGDRPVDAIVTTFAFHHLPDFWKGIALQRMNYMLQPGGQLYIHDVIMDANDALANISAFVQKQAAAGGDFLREDAEGHFREEYSTYDWVMDGLLARSGFTVRSKHIDDGVLGTYLCAKN